MVSKASSDAVTPSAASSADCTARWEARPTATALIMGMEGEGLSQVFSTMPVAPARPQACTAASGPAPSRREATTASVQGSTVMAW